MTSLPPSQKPKEKEKAAEKQVEKEEVHSIFILKSQPTTLVQAENFLRNRNWIVGSGTNLREALAYIIQKHPQYILVTADHPNRKVRIFPKMLSQAFPIRAIGFAEKGSGISTKNLHEMGLEYNLYPPVSGPAIERMVLRIKKEEEERAIEKENQIKAGMSSDAPATGQDLITFKGGTNPSDSMKTSFEQARAALNQLISSDSTGEEGPAIVAGSGVTSQTGSGMPGDGGSHSKDSAGYTQTGSGFGGDGYSQTGPGSSGSGIAYNPHNQTNTAGAGGIAYDPNRPSTYGNQSGSASGAGYFNPQDPNSPSEGSGGFLDGQSAWDRNSQTSQLRMNTDPNSPDTNASEDDSFGPGGRGSRNKSAPVMESEYARKTPKAPYRIRQEKAGTGIDGDQSVFVRGAQQALSESTNLKGEETAEEIEAATDLACITVESPKFSGYLVCAMGRKRKIDQAFIQILHQRLFKFLRDNGENVKDQDAMSLKIQEVDFTAWTMAQAEFLKKSVHDGDEVAIAFFPTAIKTDEFQKSASDKMLMVNLAELQDDAIVEFDLYIFMPENNKYLLYTPQGRPLYGQQKGRLKEKGVTHMHLRKESAHEMKKYRAQNFLNDKIKSYKKTA